MQGTLAVAFHRHSEIAQFEAFVEATGYNPAHPESFLKHWPHREMPTSRKHPVHRRRPPPVHEPHEADPNVARPVRVLDHRFEVCEGCVAVRALIRADAMPNPGMLVSNGSLQRDSSTGLRACYTCPRWAGAPAAIVVIGLVAG